ncbi:MAG: LysM peptidoglycan-binding domain-containing protein [Dehalococcoidia bacterium]|nr:LysM peptidoglycan-binding domain-containing protein [Dehalococcoidia bacterium]
MRGIISLIAFVLAAGLLAGCDGRADAPGGPDAAPETSASTYVVQPGDSLAQLAADFGIALAELAEANAIADPSTIEAGQVLVVPSGATDPPGERDGGLLDRLPRPSLERNAVLNGLAAAASLPLAVLLFFAGRAAYERYHSVSSPAIGGAERRERDEERDDLASEVADSKAPVRAAPLAPASPHSGTESRAGARRSGTRNGGRARGTAPTPPVDDDLLPPPPPSDAAGRRNGAPGPTETGDAPSRAPLQAAATEAVGRSGSALRRLGTRIAQSPRPGLPSLPTLGGHRKSRDRDRRWLIEGQELERQGLLSEAAWKFQYGLEEAEREGWDEAAALYREALESLSDRRRSAN